MAGKESSRKYAWLENVHRSSHTPKTKNVAWAIFYFANSKTLHCWPNYDTLDEVLGGKGNGKNIGDHIKALEKSGYLKIGKQQGEKFRSNGYWLTFPEPCDEARGGEEDQEPPAEPSESHGQEGVTLSRTLSDNSFTNSFNEKPSASEIKEDEEVKEESFTQSSWLSTVRPNAALPPCAEDDDSLSVIENILDTPARQHAASPPIADIEHQLSWDSRKDEIPNEEW